jgi:hypothetical protein
LTIPAELLKAMGLNPELLINPGRHTEAGPPHRGGAPIAFVTEEEVFHAINTTVSNIDFSLILRKAVEDALAVKQGRI